MKLVIDNNLKVISPDANVLHFAEKELSFPNPEYEKKQRMGFWVGNTPKKICLYKLHGDCLVLPYGCLSQVYHFFAIGDIEWKIHSVTSVAYGGDDINLYDYQQIALDKMLVYRNGILIAPAGSGKTQMAIAFIKKLGLRALWVTHTKDLLNQSKDRAERYLNSNLVGTITEGKVNIGQGITFATVQTLANIDLPQYKDFWDVIVVDECHRVCGSPTQLTRFYKVLDNLSARYKIGLTATAHRADGLFKSTEHILGPIFYEVPKEAVKDKVMQVSVFPISLPIELGYDCFDTDGTILYSNLISYLCNNSKRNSLIGSFLQKNKGHSCLILSDRIGHLRELMKYLPYDDCAIVHGKMTTKQGKSDREQAIQDMRDGKKHYLFATYSLAKEGLDIPRLDRLFLATPQKDYAVITQSIGRIARTFEGKENPVVYDFVDENSFCHNEYKKRCAVYRKNDCKFIEKDD